MLTPSNSALHQFSAPDQKGSRLPWYVAVVGCLYYGWLGFGIQKVVPIFTKLFDGLGVEIPLPAQLFFSNYTWLAPALYLSAIVLTIVKQFGLLNEPLNRIANWFLLFTGAVFPALVILALYSPLLVLIHRLHSAK